MNKNGFVLTLLVYISFSHWLYATEIADFYSAHTITIKSKLLNESVEFAVKLPESYFSEKDKKYSLLIDFQTESQSFLIGTHYWLSHNSEWPWLETIIITPTKHHKSLVDPNVA